MERPPTTPHGPPPAEVSVDISGAPGCIAAARAAAVAFLRHHTAHAPGIRHTFHGDTLLVVSELVTNAVRHAPGPAVLKLRLRAGGIEITVRDTNPSPPHTRPPDLTGGRGWPLVQSLAHRVRVVACPNGKTVHAEMAW